MTQMNGHFSQNGHPLFNIQIFGHSRTWAIPVEAMLDTGFSGFLSLPLSYCLKAGLILASTADYTLADGSTNSTLLCWGTIIINDQEIIGLVAISFRGNQPLLGMDFLRRTNKRLELDAKSLKVSLS